MSNTLEILAIAALAGIYLFTVYGFIGPEKLRQRMRRLIQWDSVDSSPFLPVDPYKPTGQALQEAANNVLPTKKRMSEFARRTLFNVLYLISSSVFFVWGLATDHAVAGFILFIICLLASPFIAAFFLIND